MGNRKWETGEDSESEVFAGFSEDSQNQPIKDHRDLIVWQTAMGFAEAVYKASSSFRRDELYGLTSQLRRAAVSISSNIAEGYGRGTRGAYVQFLRIAQGSTRECHSLLELSARLGFLSDPTHKSLEETAIGILKMLGSLIRKLDQSA